MLYLPLIVALFALVFAGFLIKKIQRAPAGSGKMIAIANYIKEGAVSYLKRQFKTVGLVAIFLFFVLWLLLGIKTGLGFLVGAFFSGLAGFIGMMISTKANVRVAEAAQNGLGAALRLAFWGGSGTGVLVVGLGLLAVTGFYKIGRA